MSDQENVTNALSALGTSLRQHPSVRDRVLRGLEETTPAGWAPASPERKRGGSWGALRIRRWWKAAISVAACVALAAVASLVWGNGAQKAFAEAVAFVQKARTFACRAVVESRDGDASRVDMDYTVMFREPDLYRYESSVGANPITLVVDYNKRRQMRLDPVEKAAVLENITDHYEVDAKSGQTRVTQLDTRVRSELLDLATTSAGAVQDLGLVQIDGQAARLLRSQSGERVTSVWVQPQTGVPMQIEMQKPQVRIVWTGIRIDEPLSDDLFSLQPPAGYTLAKEAADTPPSGDRRMKMFAKMMRLGMLCAEYQSNHGLYPEKLSDLIGGETTEAALKTLLAEPDASDGPAVIQYRPPRPNAEPGKEIILHEAFEMWPAAGIVVGYADGHCGVIATQAELEAAMK